jgi:AcrR family transcriptional regulator
MAADQSAPDPSRGRSPGSWRELAVARSLDPARARAEKRVQRFLDAAMELMTAAEARDFTVQEVVERSGQSLRSFYQYFAGKHELLLALFEESIRDAAEHLRARVAAADDPLERLHVFCIEHYLICRPSPAGKRSKSKVTNATRALAEFAQQLLTEHPKEAARAFEPMVELLDEVLAGAAEAGEIRPDIRGGRMAGVILQAVMFNAFAATISSTSLRSDPNEAAEELWGFILHGIGTPTAD